MKIKENSSGPVRLNAFIASYRVVFFSCLPVCPAENIRISEWERVTTYMYGITLITENQERILAEVLDELRHGLNDMRRGVA